MNKYLLSPQESKVFKMIPRGLENAKRLEYIYKPLNLREREVNIAIQSMCRKNIPICSSRKEPFGVYIPLDEEERRVGLNALNSQVNNMEQRIKLVENIDLDTWEDTIVITEQTRLEKELIN